MKIFIIAAVIKVALVAFLLLTGVAYMTWLERKVIGHMQNRWGPTRVGPFGLLQPLADGIKFILKEDMVPDKVHKVLYIMAPMLALIMSLISIAVIPFGETISVGGHDTALQITGVAQAHGTPPLDINIGLLIILGATSIGVYGIALAGWSSNSKYALLGSLRASAQMISYELALGLSLVGVLILSGTLSLRGIVDSQIHQPAWLGFLPHWYIFPQFIAFFVYLMSAYAETNRIPFDLPEAETELVAGYHTEYSAMKFAMFFMAEYVNMITVGCVATLLFFGGWHGPSLGISSPLIRALLPVIWFSAKIFVFMFVYIWIRGTLPRFRYDQLMAFGWKFLLPIAIVNIIVTSLIVALRS
ncbi:MAG TPA: NADH-quinone oxidoreductase subunit NuoH [Candidatus Angelobacter sp.]|nr:NADH-quinone oxidoreductase subunit NuoH [Candidatus Angelobacter sp.]